MISASKFNEGVAWPLRALLVSVGGLALLFGGIFAFRFSPAVYFKLKGNSPDCPWGRALAMYGQSQDLARRSAAIRASLSVVEDEPAARLAKVRLAGSRGDAATGPRHDRAFWVSHPNGLDAELDLLAYLLADHDWVASLHAEQTVRPGDIVMDCGAHVGVFTNLALERGAARVIAIEPDPSLAGCLRRNFETEISGGRVAVLEAAVWSSPGTMPLRRPQAANSGMASLLEEQAPASTVSVRVTTIDRIAEGLPRVDYIKMDIEGAEGEALRGAAATLRRSKPRLMLDSYHHRDDARVLHEIARQMNAAYSVVCGPCVSDGRRLVPHLIFLR